MTSIVAGLDTLMLLPQLEAQIHAHIVKSPSPHLLNSAIRSAAHSANPETALHVFNHLFRRSVPHDHFSFTFAVKACCSLLRRHSHAAAKGREIHARALKSGLCADIFLQNSLVSLYATSGDVDSASSVFSGITFPDVVSWTSFIAGLARNGRMAEAIAVFSRMDLEPNPVTLVAVLSACSRLGALQLGKAIHGHRLRTSHGARNLILDNAILDMYMRCSAPNSARHMFAKMTQRDVFSWTTAISGYTRNGRPDEAISIFRAMVQHGEAVPNEATLVSVLGACASMAALSSGKWVHSYMDMAGVGVEGHAGNALMNMYAKCGDMASALEVFHGLPGKDLTAWCTLLGGMALNGLGKHAIELFSLMIRHGVQPDGVAFLAVLSACQHAGLVDQGLLFLSAMGRASCVSPEQQHYGCVADMLGRAGMLEEAEAFAAEIMPTGLDSAVRSALLNACKIHCPEAKGCERLVDGGLPAGGGTYALLCNAFAGAGDWSLAVGAREAMRRKGVKKAAGCSWLDPPLEQPTARRV